MENPFEILQQEIRQLQGMVGQLLARIESTQVAAIEEPIFMAEAARLLKISKGALYRNVQDVPHTKLHGQYYFFHSQLLAYLKGDKPPEESKTIQVKLPIRRVKKILGST